MPASQHSTVFRKGSKTYYFSSFFFPRAVRNDVYVLYGFVRIADNLVDDQRVDKEAFYRFRSMYEQVLKTGEPCKDPIIDSFVELQKRKQFEQEWVDAFLDSMEQDLDFRPCEIIEDSIRYMYGSAEVIGLFMAKVMDLVPESYHYAAMLGRAMQYINFLRDIEEDNRLGRRYIPLKYSNLQSLSKTYVESHQEQFEMFIKSELQRYMQWQRSAAEGYRFIPRRYRIPIMTAADMYCWTARMIQKNPMVVYEKKVKPSKFRIIRRALAHLFNVASGCSL